MTAEEMINLFELQLKKSAKFVNNLRKKPDSYAVDYAIGMFKKYLTGDDELRQRQNLVYGPQLHEAICKIIEALTKKRQKNRQRKFEHNFGLLAFVIGPRRFELIASAVTPCGCLSD